MAGMNDQSNFRQGFDFIMLNAKAHLRTAELTASEGLYGIANSHLILCSEEAIKGYMVFSRHFDPELAIKDFQKFFSDHKFKHQTIRDMMSFLNFTSRMLDISIGPLLQLAMTKKRKNVSEDEILAARDKGVDDLIAWLKFMPNIEYNEQWWNEANTNKNKGFYVNLLNDNWQTPSEITEEHYEKSFQIVTQLLEWMSRITEAEKDPEMMKLYLKIKAAQEGNPE
jgi:AbiV family abortive infection protein